MLAQYDATRDILGTFYCLGDWRKKYEDLRVALEEHFGFGFKDNGNSFASCFQFVEEARPGRMPRRIKVYNKFLVFLQSETAKKGIGMNLKAIYYSDAGMY